MRIKKITSQHRRDFTAVYVCEHCGAEKTDQGYDDDNFHRHVVPKMTCHVCGKAAPADFRPMKTKYAAHDVV